MMITFGKAVTDFQANPVFISYMFNQILRLQVLSTLNKKCAILASICVKS